MIGRLALALRIGVAVALGAAAWLPGGAAAQVSASPFTSGTRYDALHRVTGTISPDPDATGPIRHAAVRNTYDADGRLVRVEKGELAAWQSEAVAPSDWPNFTVFSQVDTSYDALDRKTVEKVSSGSTAYTLTQYGYDGVGRLQCTAVRMAPGLFASLPASACTPGPAGSYGDDRITKNVYDDAGQLLRVQKAFGTSLQQDYARYTYSQNGKPLTVVDADGHQAAYSYDGQDRQIAWSFPSKTSPGATAGCTIAPITQAGGVTSPSEARAAGDDCEKYAYDLNGNRTKLMKRDGRVLRYSYDMLDRMMLKDVPGGTGADVYYGYDAWGRQSYARFGGPSGQGLTNVYDGFGRLVSASSDQGGTAWTIGHGYDADGNRILVTHPDGTSFAYEYDGLDRVGAVKQNGMAVIASMAYNARGERTGLTRGAVSTSYSHDAISRLAGIADDLGGTAGDVTSTMAYDPASQIVTRTRSNDGYAFGDYLTVSRSYAVNGLNQYTSAGPATFGYDANGNLTSDGTTSYGYDVENRLVSASHGATTVAALVYDPQGRLYQTGGGAAGTTRLLYDGDELVAEYASTGAVLRRYVHGPGDDDPLIWYEGAGLSDRRSLQGDQQGSIVSIADSAGTLVGIDAYDEYGIPGAGNIGRFQYTGQAWIPELGMYYYKARMYSPTLGRFPQTDPVGYADQNNLYAYVANDPVNNTDPTGQECNKDRTACTSDNFEAGRSRAPDISHNPKVDSAVISSRGDYGSSSKGGEPTGTFKVSGDSVTVITTASTKGSTSTGDTAKFTLKGADGGVHGHIGGSVTDDPPSNGGYGDTQSIGQGKVMYTVEGGRVGVHDSPGGQLRFDMVRGKMTAGEAKQIQKNLDTAQHKYNYIGPIP